MIGEWRPADGFRRRDPAPATIGRKGSDRVNDDVHGFLDRALPEDRVPFHVDGAAVAASGRRLRRRRTAVAAAGITGVAVLGVTAALAGFGAGPPDGTGPAAKREESASTDAWDDSAPWNRTERDPLTDADTEALGEAITQVFAEVLDVELHGGGEAGGIEPGRYTETSPNGDHSRDLVHGSGWFIDPDSADGFNIAVKVSVYEPGPFSDPGVFIDCDADGVVCEDRVGPDDEKIVAVTRDTASGDVVIRGYEIYLHRADGSIAALAAEPALEPTDSADGTVTPLDDLARLCDTALALPQDVEV